MRIRCRGQPSPPFPPGRAESRTQRPCGICPFLRKHLPLGSQSRALPSSESAAYGPVSDSAAEQRDPGARKSRAHRKHRTTSEPLQFRGSFIWQRVKDSNPHIQSQSLLCYLYTNPLYPSAAANRYYYTEKVCFVKGFFKFFLSFLSCGSRHEPPKNLLKKPCLECGFRLPGPCAERRSSAAAAASLP